MHVTPIYSIDSPPGTFENRVFVGGNYQHGAVIEDIADAVRDFEFTPIIVWEFGVPQGTERHSSKEILRQCKYAIFDVSSAAGHFFEMDDAEEFSTVCLCVWDAHLDRGDGPRISAMVKSHALFTNNKPFRNTRTLQSEVHRFLENQTLATAIPSAP